MTRHQVFGADSLRFGQVVEHNPVAFRVLGLLAPPGAPTAAAAGTAAILLVLLYRRAALIA